MVEHATVNRDVEGSSPSSGASAVLLGQRWRSSFRRPRKRPGCVQKWGQHLRGFHNSRELHHSSRKLRDGHGFGADPPHRMEDMPPKSRIHRCGEGVWNTGDFSGLDCNDIVLKAHGLPWVVAVGSTHPRAFRGIRRARSLRGGRCRERTWCQKGTQRLCCTGAQFTELHLPNLIGQCLSRQADGAVHFLHDIGFGLRGILPNEGDGSPVGPGRQIRQV